MKKYTRKQQEQIIEQYKNGIAIKDLVAEHGISRTTIYNWIKSYNKTISKDKNVNSVHLLNKKVQKLTEILEIKSIVKCNANSPLKDKLYELEKLHSKYPVHSLCEALQVDRGTYYNHVLRNKKQDTWYKKRREELSMIVLEVYNEYNQIFGPVKLLMY